jgi:hypothetical protein
MYLNFDVKEINGVKLPHPATNKITTKPEGPYYISLDDFPQYARSSGSNDLESALWDGWFNFPLFEFDQLKYDAGKDPFVPFDYTQFDPFQKTVRTHVLSQNINSKIQGFVETKVHRRAIKRIIELLSETMDLSEDTEIKLFTDLNAEIENTIAEYPKTKNGLKKIDVKKINGGKYETRTTNRSAK